MKLTKVESPMGDAIRSQLKIDVERFRDINKKVTKQKAQEALKYEQLEKVSRGQK